MFQRHVTKDLPAYRHNELTSQDAHRVAAHLLKCSACREAYEEIKLGDQLAQQLSLVSAPASLWSGIEDLLEAESHPAAASKPQLSRLAFAFTWPRFVVINVMLVLLLFGCGAAWYYTERRAQPAWDVASLMGQPIVDTERITKSGRLAVGDWIETDDSSRARIDVADIGHVEIDPGTRVRLMETGSAEHRIQLARGRLHAMIYAPPRLFFVETPSAVAVDYGCAYILEVDDAGRSFLHVTAGWVMLESPNRESFVPAGALCETRLGAGPGTPHFEDASARLRSALAKFDFEGGEGGATAQLDTVLAEARVQDTLTLWHLLSRVSLAERGRVYDRLTALVAAPEGVERSKALELDRETLERWREKLEEVW